MYQLRSKLVLEMISTRKITLLLLLAQPLWIAVLLSAAVPAQASRPGLRHHLTVTLDPARHRLEAEDQIQVSASGLSQIEFHLAGHLTIQSVTVNGSKSDYDFDAGRLRIPLPRGQTVGRLQINYAGRFDDPVPDAPLNTDNPGFGVTGTIRAQGTMLLAGAGWYPEAQGWAEAFDLTVNAPEGMVGVTSGNSLGHVTRKGRTLSRWSLDQDLRGISLVAGPYEVTTRKFGEVTAATYFTAPLKHLSNDYLEATGRYLQLYEGLFGPYAFSQFAVVENFFPTGYGFPSFTLLGRQVLQLPFIIHTSLGHEIAHCWWGNGVLVDPSQGNWSEGLTTYVADYLYKERRGLGQDQRLQWLRNFAGLVNPNDDFPLSRFTGRTDPATRTVGYDKGAMVFHMLRQIVGEADFWQSLRDIYTRHRFEAIAWSDIQAAFEGRSGHSLTRFFEQWVFNAGAPRLSLAQVAVNSVPGGFTVSGLINQRPPYFDLTLEAALRTDSETVQQTVSSKGRQSAFSITVSSRPRQLTVDPHVHIFRRLEPSEVPPTINTIKGSDRLCVVVARDQGPGGLEAAERLTMALGLDRAPISMENAFSADDLARKDLILVGLPSDRIWRPGPNDRFRVTPGGFVLNGHAYSGPLISFFGVFRHPGGNGRSIALFLPADESLAKTVSAKITHYGKYSYLVFDKSGNQVKGTWEADQSPLTARWPE